MPEVPNYFHATVLCKFFLRGECTRGKSCTYAHGATKLRAKPDLKKTKLCESFSISGACQKGDFCTFAHENLELRKQSRSGYVSTKPPQFDLDGAYEIERARCALRIAQACQQNGSRMMQISAEMLSQMPAASQRMQKQGYHSGANRMPLQSELPMASLIADSAAGQSPRSGHSVQCSEAMPVRDCGYQSTNQERVFPPTWNVYQFGSVSELCSEAVQFGSVSELCPEAVQFGSRQCTEEVPIEDSGFAQSDTLDTLPGFPWQPQISADTQENEWESAAHDLPDNREILERQPQISADTQENERESAELQEEPEKPCAGSASSGRSAFNADSRSITSSFGSSLDTTADRTQYYHSADEADIVVLHTKNTFLHVGPRRRKNRDLFKTL